MGGVSIRVSIGVLIGVSIGVTRGISIGVTRGISITIYLAMGDGGSVVSGVVSAIPAILGSSN